MCKLANIVLKLKGMQMRHIGLLLVIIFSLSAYAADHPVKALGPAVAEVVYKRTKCLDTTKVGIDYRIDLMTLKAGKCFLFRRQKALRLYLRRATGIWHQNHGGLRCFREGSPL